MYNINLSLNLGTTKSEITAAANAITNAVQVANPITRFAILRTLQAAAEEACKSVTEPAISEALRVHPETGHSLYPGAAEGKDFTCEGNRLRVMIRNEYPYGEQTILGDNGTRRDDPNAALWRAERALVEERKEKNKVSTKRITALEATLLQDHPRMKPIETSISIALRNAK